MFSGIVEIDGKANALISSDILFSLFVLLLFVYFKWHKADFFSHQNWYTDTFSTNLFTVLFYYFNFSSAVFFSICSVNNIKWW